MSESKNPLERVPRWLLAALSGVILGISQPLVIEAIGDEPLDPSGITGALAVIGFVPVLLALRGVGPKRAYWLGFIASFVQFTINVQWLVTAMVVFGQIPLVASWAILSLLTAAMAAYVAAAYAITRIVVGRFHVPMWIVFPVVLCATETLRNFGPLGGFPWGNVGTSFATVPLLLQAAAIFGVHGLVLLAALSSSTIAELLHWFFTKRTAPTATSSVGGPISSTSAGGAPELRASLPRRPAIALGVLVVAWVGFGLLRFATEPSGPDVPIVKVGLLQGNIEQGIRNDEPWTGKKILQRYHELSDEAVARGAQLVVWPEAAFPVRQRRDITSMQKSRVVDDDGPVPQALVVGAVSYQPVVVDGRKREERHNSAFIVGENLEVKGRVDKTHLVPFGEYVPWPLGAIVRQIVPIGGTTPGEGYEGIPVKLGDREVKIGTTICYEGIFPEISRALRNAGAQLHVNVTNDGWYGISAAATQHLAFYAVRAVESGMPVVRAANTGKSAWVDTRGRMHDVTRIYEHSAVVASVPLVNSWTPYLTFGEWLSLPCVVVTLLAWLYAMLGAGFHKRSRHMIERVIGFGGLALAAISIVAYYTIDGMRADEANATRFLLLTLFGLLVGVGALSGRTWGRKAQIVVGIIAVVCGLAGAALGPLWSLLIVVVGGAVFVLALLRRDQYRREVEPLTPPDTA